MANYGAIPLIIIFFLGIAFALPDEANIGVMILEEMNKSMCSGNLAGSELACKSITPSIITMRILAILVTLGDLAFIVSQIKEGNLW